MTRVCLYCLCIGANRPGCKKADVSFAVQLGRGNGSVVDINATVDALGDKCKGLLGMHTLSGCDTASYPNAWKMQSVRLASTHSTNLIQSWRGQCYPERHTDNRHCLHSVPLYCQKETTSLNSCVARNIPKEEE